RTSSVLADPDPSNDCDSLTLTILRPADLAVSVAPEAPTVAPGQAARWTVTVTNLGPGTATDPRLTAKATGAAGDHPVDSLAGDGSASPASGVAWTWTPGTLAPGATAIRTFTADTTSWVPGETVTLVA